MAAIAVRGQDPVLNTIFMKLALLFAPKGAELSAMHIWSENDALANTLGRLAEGAVLTPLLAKVPRSDPSRDGFYIIGNTVELLPVMVRVARSARPSGVGDPCESLVSHVLCRHESCWPCLIARVVLLDAIVFRVARVLLPV